MDPPAEGAASARIHPVELGPDASGYDGSEHSTAQLRAASVGSAPPLAARVDGGPDLCAVTLRRSGTVDVAIDTYRSWDTAPAGAARHQPQHSRKVSNSQRPMDRLYGAFH